MQNIDHFYTIQSAHDAWDQNEQAMKQGDTQSWGRQIGVVVGLLHSGVSDEHVAHFLANHCLQTSKGIQESRSVNRAVNESGRANDYKEFCQRMFNFEGIRSLPREIVNVILPQAQANLKELFALCQVDKESREIVRQRLMNEIEFSYENVPYWNAKLKISGSLCDSASVADLKQLAAIITLLQEDVSQYSFRDQAWLLGVDLALNAHLTGDLPHYRIATFWSQALVCSLLKYSEGHPLDMMIDHAIVPKSGAPHSYEDDKSIESHLSKVSWIKNCESSYAKYGSHNANPSHINHFLSRLFSERAEKLSKFIILSDELEKHYKEFFLGHTDKESTLCKLPKEMIMQIVKMAFITMLQSREVKQILPQE